MNYELLNDGENRLGHLQDHENRWTKGGSTFFRGGPNTSKYSKYLDPPVHILRGSNFYVTDMPTDPPSSALCALL